jgi:hypothetical protein
MNYGGSKGDIIFMYIFLYYIYIPRIFRINLFKQTNPNGEFV